MHIEASKSYVVEPSTLFQNEKRSEEVQVEFMLPSSVVTSRCSKSTCAATASGLEGTTPV